ncbi:MAG: Nicotinate phosphoribosyltransferase pncB2 [Chlamydiae bacterium]|nr:Nicotinate phosphoribosyltransferase pncB2 [Chlamydiota bacterium]
MANQALLKRVYRDSLGLLTDLYELTMAYAYWKNGLADREAVFQLFFRKHPFKGSYAICAGIQTVIEYIENFHFDSEDLTYLEGLKTPKGTPLFERAFLDYLQGLSLNLDIDAMQEGTLVFPYEPLIRVKGPIIEAQIIESALLNIVNFQTLIATKASRVCFAAQGDHIVEFGLRRAQGVDGAIAASRAAYIGGCHSTSHVLAGKLFGIPVMGTHAHSWVMTFEKEKEAFVKFARTFPESSIFLIDTYDTVTGVEQAIAVAKELEKEEIPLIAVRLDSGDLYKLSNIVRDKLDAAGLTDTKIMATNELTEQIIADLKHQGAKITLWGVGTNLVTAKDQPALDGVYKLSAVADEKGAWHYRLKISDQVIKTTNPGISQVRRYFDKGKAVADMLYDVEMGSGTEVIHHVDFASKVQVNEDWDYEDLLVPMLRKGKSVYSHPSIVEMRENTYAELERFDPSIRRFLNPGQFFSGIERKLFDRKLKMIDEIQKR